MNDMESENIVIGDYTIIRTLGEGTTCKVKLAKHRETGQYFAIKTIRKATLFCKPDLQSKIQREIALMRVIDHPNILKLYSVLESDRCLYIVLEYAKNGELFDYLVSARSLQENLAISFFRQIIFGLEYLHQHSICHRDLKPENILLDNHFHIKVADFGFARWMRKNTAITSCGSVHFAAPEVIKGQEYNGEKADIWSVGVILFTLLSGVHPFEDTNIRNLLVKIKRGEYEMPKKFHPDIQDLIGGMLVVDVNQRFSINRIKNHKAFRLGLPSDYMLPRPVPFVELNEPVEISHVSENMIQTLVEIGIPIHEIKEDLQRVGTNMTKVFVSILKGKPLIEQLQWNKAIKEIDPSKQDDGYGELVPKFQEMSEPSTVQVSIEKSITSITSWFNLESEDEFENSTFFGPFTSFNVQILADLQKILVESGFVFFYPDQFQFLGKNISKMYVKLKFQFSGEDQILLLIEDKNPQKIVKEKLLAQIEALVSNEKIPT